MHIWGLESYDQQLPCTLGPLCAAFPEAGGWPTSAIQSLEDQLI